MEKKQRTHNFWWSIPGKKGGRNIARTRPPNGGGIVPPVLSADQGGHFTPGGRGGGHRLVLRVRIHREGVQEPHGSQAASTTSLSTPFSWCLISLLKPFLGPPKQPPYPLLHQSLSFRIGLTTLSVCSHIFADFSTTVWCVTWRPLCLSRRRLRHWIECVHLNCRGRGGWRKAALKTQGSQTLRSRSLNGIARISGGGEGGWYLHVVSGLSCEPKFLSASLCTIPSKIGACKTFRILCAV